MISLPPSLGTLRNRQPELQVLRYAGVLLAAVLLAAGCSVDSRGFGGSDAGLGGGTTETGGQAGGSSSSGGAPGNGGVSGSGGIPGSGGAHASGGTPGSGGESGSGGNKSGSGGNKSGSGGKTGNGGGAASGGISGSGGNSGGTTGSGGGSGGAGGGSGGSGPGGHPGTGGLGGTGAGGISMGTGGEAGKPGGGGGHGGEGGKTCEQLVSEYAKALQEARVCTPGATAQCQQLAAQTLSSCNACPQVPVNDASRVTMIRSQWLAQGCAMPTLCPAIACVMPRGAICAMDTNGPDGICQASGIIAN